MEGEHLIGGRNTRIESFDATDLLSDMDRNELIKVFSDDDDDGEPDRHRTLHQHNTRRQTRSTSKTRAIPVPGPHPPPPPAAVDPASQAPSAASSQGSSGSAFLSAVMNPAFGSGALSHTPPYTGGASSYETKHFGKRTRSGSVSGRLRSASDYLEEKGLLDRQTKGILKDLIIIGDEELQHALDSYEMGDPSCLEEMIQSGALQNRLPQDLDILGDLDLDFLTMDEDVGIMGQHASAAQEDHDIEALSDQHDDDDDDAKYRAMQIPPTVVAGAHQLHLLHQQPPPNKISPPYGDGIGELEFSGDFVTEDYSSSMHQMHQPFASKNVAASSPVESKMSDYERRLRSNSLFSALLNDPRAAATTLATAAARPGRADHAQYGQWMDRAAEGASSNAVSNRKGGIDIRKPKAATAKNNRRLSAPEASGLAASLESERKKREKEIIQEQKKKERLEKKERKQQDKKKAADDEEEDLYVPGSGRPRSLSDPNLRFSLDENGMQHVVRPAGWIGAYSPDSRTVRIARFLEKRNRRVWTKSVKYDVRKNFADSRLRVKGRFVKKEEESLMRELMSLT